MATAKISLQEASRRNSPMLSQKYIDEMHEYIDSTIADLQALSKNAIISAVSEEVAISKLATTAIQSTRSVLETEALSLIGTMETAYNEAHGALRRLKDTNEAVSKESSFICQSLSPIKRMTVEVSEYSNQIERLNNSLSVLKQHIDSGIFDVAAKLGNASKVIVGGNETKVAVG